MRTEHHIIVLSRVNEMKARYISNRPLRIFCVCQARKSWSHFWWLRFLFFLGGGVKEAHRNSMRPFLAQQRPRRSRRRWGPRGAG